MDNLGWGVFQALLRAFLWTVLFIILLALALAYIGGRVLAAEPAQAELATDLIGAQSLPGVGNLNPPGVIAMDIPDRERLWFFNTDGSCVQCSAGMVGLRGNLPAWTFLLWDTEYGRAQRGGSGPDRVARYARARGMRLFNVTGRESYPYMEWAAKTGRFAAIGYFGSHFQTHYGRDYTHDQYLVANNWSGCKVTSYSLAEFKRHHEASGLWCFVPDEPPAPPGPFKIVEWWK